MLFLSGLWVSKRNIHFLLASVILPWPIPTNDIENSFFCLKYWIQAHVRMGSILSISISRSDYGKLFPEQRFTIFLNIFLLMYLSGLSASLWTERLLVRFWVARAWAAGQVPGRGMHPATNSCIFCTLIFLSSLSPSLPLSLKVNYIYIRIYIKMNKFSIHKIYFHK